MVNRSKITKTSIVILLVAMTFTLVACSGDDDGNTEYNVGGTITGLNNDDIAAVKITDSNGDTIYEEQELGNNESWSTKIAEGKEITIEAQADGYTFDNSYNNITVSGNDTSYNFEASNLAARSVNLVNPPQRLLKNRLSSSSISAAATENEAEKIITEEIGNFDIAGIADKIDVYNEYGEKKIDNILKIEEDKSETLQNFNLTSEGVTYSDQDYLIMRTQDVEADYASVYDEKYTLENQDNGEIGAVLYTDKAGDRVNYIEKYDRSAYDNDRNYFQIIHNDNQNYTRIFTHEDADVEDASTNFVTVKENDSTKEYTTMRVANVIGSFAALEDSSSENITAVFNYKDSNTDDFATDSDFYASEDDINTIIDNGDTMDPIRAGHIDGWESGEYNFTTIDDFSADSGYPEKSDAQAVYDDINTTVDFGSLNDLDFDLDNFEYRSNQNLIEVFGLE